MNKVDSSVIRERLEASFCMLDIASEVERHTSTRLGKSDSCKQYNGACPFEDCSADTNGFIVWHELTERGCHFWCRQCGRKGDILKLVMDIKGLGFLDACRELGIPNPYKEDGEIDSLPRTPVQKRAPVVSDWLKNELQDLHRVYPHARKALNHERAMAYLAERAVPFEIAQEHGLGYIPAQSGSIDEKYIRWADRIVFPIHTPNGDMGFCGRSLYLWTPGMDEDAHKAKLDAHNQGVDDFSGWGTDQKVIRWLYTYQQGFFNWQVAEESTRLVFVEGPFDVLACLAAGIPHTISIGTTGIDASMIPFNVESTIMALDVDGPGRKAAKDLAKSLRRKGIDVEICMPVDAKDWSAAYRVHGSQGLAPIQVALHLPSEDIAPEKPSVLPEWETVEPLDPIRIVPREHGVIGTVQDLQCGGLRFSIVDDNLHVEANYHWRGGGVERFIRDHEMTILDWLRANEKTVAKEPPVQSAEIKPYAPVCLPDLPRKVCPCGTLTWDGKGKQEKLFCKHKPLENGFCSEHQSVHRLLEIGTASGYPEVKISFRWKGETLYRTIHAGVSNWECYASTLSTDRPSDVREQDVKYLARQLETA